MIMNFKRSHILFIFEFFEIINRFSFLGIEIKNHFRSQLDFCDSIYDSHVLPIRIPRKSKEKLFHGK